VLLLGTGGAPSCRNKQQKHYLIGPSGFVLRRTCWFGLVFGSKWTQLDSTALLGLARAHALQKDTVSACVVYQNFPTLWRDAGPEHPPPERSETGIRKVAVGEDVGNAERFP
jgi:hypothetical protein